MCPPCDVALVTGGACSEGRVGEQAAAAEAARAEEAAAKAKAESEARAKREAEDEKARAAAAARGKAQADVGTSPRVLSRASSCSNVLGGGECVGAGQSKGGEAV
eukprot:3111236-Rhodomonas_salina.1